MEQNDNVLDTGPDMAFMAKLIGMLPKDMQLSMISLSLNYVYLAIKAKDNMKKIAELGKVIEKQAEALEAKSESIKSLRKLETIVSDYGASIGSPGLTISGLIESHKRQHGLIKHTIASRDNVMRSRAEAFDTLKKILEDNDWIEV